jgi:hypothetical protein
VRRRLIALVAGSALVAATFIGTPASAAPGDAADAGPTVYVGDVSREQLAQVVATGIDRDELTLSVLPGGAVRVEAVLSPSQASKLVATGVPLTEKQVAGTSASQRMSEKAASGYTVFRSWSEPGGLRDELVATAKAHPGLVKQVTIGKTVQGQDILAFKVTKDANRVKDGRRPAVLYSSNQHAREWITPEMTRRLFNYYLDNYSSNKEIRQIVDTTELWFVVSANPDGYDYTFTEDHRLWRKNLRDNDGDGQITGLDGVDLNRNYPYKWGYDNEGSSPSISSETYRGTGPSSEPETQAMDGLMRRVGFEFLINYHSAAELLLYGVGWQVATPTPDDQLYETLAGDDVTPAVPGYDPDIAAELYTTNGETTEQAHNTYDTLSFTPEMSTCESASEVDPDDAWEADDCESVFNFPDSEELVEAEFQKNIPFAIAVAKSAQDPSNPVSVVGRTAPDFQVDKFTVSYGDPQTVAVTARRDISSLALHYKISGERERRTGAREWRGGERYGDEGDIYYGEYRGTIRGADPGDQVEVWFTGNRRLNSGRTAVESEHFTYTVAQDTGNDVLVLANEDYEGYNSAGNPFGPDPATGPRYLQTYVNDLAAAGISASTWDVSAQGVPHDLGVLSHFDAVLWYLGDNRLTQDREDVFTDVGGDIPIDDESEDNGFVDASVAERQQYLTLAVRDYLNDGGKLAMTGETAGYAGSLGVGGSYYAINGFPDQECVIVTSLRDDCLILADDFVQYYLGGYTRSDSGAATSFDGIGEPFGDVTAELTGTPSNAVDEAGKFVVTSDVLPVDEFPQFASEASGQYVSAGGGPFDPFEGSWYAAARHADDSYMRLARTVDLTAVGAGQAPKLEFALSYDVEPEYDNVIVEVHTVGQDNWTTLPKEGGGSSTAPPADCDIQIEANPFLAHYLTPPTTPNGNCLSTGTSGAWNALTGTSNGWTQAAFDLSAYAGQQVEVSVSYITDGGVGGTGVFVDNARLDIGGTDTQLEGFETDTGAWTFPGAPDGSPATGDFVRSQAATPTAAVTTEDSVLLGFGVEQIADAGKRADILGRMMEYLLD